MLLIESQITPINDGALIKHLTKFGISKQVWDNCEQLKQIQYIAFTRKMTPIKNICFVWENDKNGFQVLGTDGFRCTVGEFAYTTIKHSESMILSVFFDCFTYLAALEYFPQLEGTSIVANHVRGLEMIIQHKKTLSKYQFMLFFSNDPQKQFANRLLMNNFSATNMCETLYPNHTDFISFSKGNKYKNEPNNLVLS